jgi:hypothetical protein
MSIKQKPIKICDSCGVEIHSDDRIKIEANMHYESYASIIYGENEYHIFDGLDFCCFDCLIEELMRVLVQGACQN